MIKQAFHLCSWETNYQKNYNRLLICQQNKMDVSIISICQLNTKAPNTTLIILLPNYIAYCIVFSQSYKPRSLVTECRKLPCYFSLPDKHKLTWKEKLLKASHALLRGVCIQLCLRTYQMVLDKNIKCL